MCKGGWQKSLIFGWGIVLLKRVFLQFGQQFLPLRQPLRQPKGLTPPLAQGRRMGGSAEPPQHIYHITGPICRQEAFV